MLQIVLQSDIPLENKSKIQLSNKFVITILCSVENRTMTSDHKKLSSILTTKLFRRYLGATLNIVNIARLFINLAKCLKNQNLLAFKQHQLPFPSFSESFSCKTQAPDPQEYTHQHVQLVQV